MNDIKEKPQNRNIKVLDKTVNVSRRIKNASIKTKEQAEGTMEHRDSVNEYAVNHKGSMARTVARKSGQAGKRFTVKAKEKVQRRSRETRRGKVWENREPGETPFSSHSGESPKSRNPGNPAEQGRAYAKKQAEKRNVQNTALARSPPSSFSPSSSTLKSSRPEAGRGGSRIKEIAGKKVKEAPKAIKTTERTAHAAIKTTESVSRKATVKAAKKARQIQQRAARKAAQSAAKRAEQAAKIMIRVTVEAVKAAVNGTMALIALFGAVPVIIVILFLAIACVLLSPFASYPGGSGAAVSEEVLQYTMIIENYAIKYEIPQFTGVLQAIMMTESGGQGKDVMQCSECPLNTKYPNKPNAITDVEYSIEVGTHYFADCLKAAGCTDPADIPKLSLALQGYNFGNGYIAWALSNFGGYSEANAQAFSDMMKQKLGTTVYGSPVYVQAVLKYCQFNSIVPGTEQFMWPVPTCNNITSEFGERWGKKHKGIDIAKAGIEGQPILAAADGTVTVAVHSGWGGGYGSHVDIDHGNGYSTRYAHCSAVLVNQGDHVNKGQIIAYVGSTGDSTGPHLHFEVLINGAAVDPLAYFDRSGITM